MAVTIRKQRFSDPLVSVITPVYNGALFLLECVESVLRQNYDNWEYVVVDNCSSDDTLKIAHSFARKDERIRVVSNERFVNCEENHNIAFRLMDRRSKYCKIISADDIMYAQCIRKMVELAEAHPTVGIVGSYQQSGKIIKWKGLEEDIRVISGREACRACLLNNLIILGNPSSVLYRSDMIRQEANFFPHTLPHSDTSASFRSLQHWDLGFVHEVLSFERVHDAQESTRSISLGMGDIGFLDDVVRYGPLYLSDYEFEIRKREVIDNYYAWLGGCVLKMRGKAFWKYQSESLRELRLFPGWGRVLHETVKEIRREIRDPRAAFRKLRDSWRNH